MYTNEEAMAQSVVYFKGDELAANVFITKYALRNKEGQLLEATPDDMHRRLAKEFARIEKNKFKKPMTEDEIYSYFKNFERIVPQGSPMYGIGNPYQYVTLSNCYVLPAPHDSYLGINYLDTQICQVSSRRGGVGWPMSTLRPKNSRVSNAAGSTTGVVSFMRRYSDTIREVCQAGRRGASLQSLDVRHPEIFDFIKCKNDDTSITGSNISVQFNDEFMNCIVNGHTQFQLQWPVTQEKDPKISSIVEPQRIWNAFIDATWGRAEPGAIFIDTVHRRSTSAIYPGFEEIAPNPCQPAWASILTPSGVQVIEDLEVGDKIWSKEGWTTVINIISQGLQKVYKYQTTAGVFYGTKEHKIVVDENNTKIEAQHAESINIITGPDPEADVVFNPRAIMDGLLIGDGSVHKASGNLIGLYIGDNDQEYFQSEIKHLIGSHRPGIKDKFYEVITLLLPQDLPHTYDRIIPNDYMRADVNTVCSFLRGLYSANGSVCGNRITLKTSSKTMMEQAQLLLSSIGIRSYYTTNKSTEVGFINGKYICKQSYDLNISTDRNKFVKHIGFIQQYKNDKIKITDGKPKVNYDIITEEYIRTDEVFDITVDNNTHTYWSQCCNVSNCGEQYLPAYGCCRLISINLYTYVKNKFTENAYFDAPAFVHDVRIMQRLADDMVDLDVECIERIIKKIKADPEPIEIKRIGIDLWTNIRDRSLADRRTGCGIVGLADMLAALNIKYDSDTSIDKCDTVFKMFKLAAYESSVEMAKELGAFPVYDYELDTQSEFIQELDEQLQLKMKKYGRRNMTLLTIAPTGSVSLLTQTSSGIEPVFMLEYTRRKKINPSEKNVKVDYVDKTGDKWAEYTVFHKGLVDWKDVNPTYIESPYAGSTAHEIDFIQKIKLQAAIQKHIDNSISVTTNLPANITKEEVSDLYLMAYKLGCKGFTIYRDGCRSGVLVAKEEKETKFTDERPRELPCDVHHITIKGQQYFVLVGLVDGKPYEVFAGKNGFLPASIKSGVIIRKRKDFYKAVFDDEIELSPITATTNEMEECITRLTSGLLRVGANMHFVVRQLEKVGERQADMHSFARSVSRALKKYIPDNTKESGVCTECKAEALIRQDGCIMCTNCGNSKCG